MPSSRRRGNVPGWRTPRSRSRGMLDHVAAIAAQPGSHAALLAVEHDRLRRIRRVQPEAHRPVAGVPALARAVAAGLRGAAEKSRVLDAVAAARPPRPDVLHLPAVAAEPAPACLACGVLDAAVPGADPAGPPDRPSEAGALLCAPEPRADPA